MAAGTRDSDCFKEQKRGRRRREGKTARKTQPGNKAAGKASSKKELEKQG